MAENLNVCTIQILTQIDVNYRVDFRNLNLKNVELRGRYQLFSDLILPSIHKELRWLDLVKRM